jgi:tRNA pseudouridine synthase 10
MLETIAKILSKGCFCDHCLGRFYYGLLGGMSNQDKGRAIRNVMAMMIDARRIDYSKIDPSNFDSFKFKINKDFIPKSSERCYICGGAFDELSLYAKKAAAKSKDIGFDNFSVGSLVPGNVLNREEEMWELVGIEHVESIKFDLNRELRKKGSEELGKPVEFSNPDVTFIADFESKEVSVSINSIFILGGYKKLSRGIPQCKWGTPGKYKTSVQEIIDGPLLKVTRGKESAFHGFGREDVDARCLDWRPFVIEIVDPKMRKVDIKKMEKIINRSKKAKVRLFKFVDKSVVRRVKTEMGDKTYQVTVLFDKPVSDKDLRKIKSIIGQITQRTPNRVAHRRADLIRRRLVKKISYKRLTGKSIMLTVTGTSGLYIKELVHGDEGRTKPSIAETLGVKAPPKGLDVIKVDGPKNL